MNVLDDSIHQLFSDILLTKGHSYEGINFPKASGFLFDNKFILDDSIGILGLGHPLKIKANLTAALYPNVQAKPNDVDKLYQEIEYFFQDLIGNISLGQFDSSSPSSHAPGRFESFFCPDDLRLIENNRVNSKGIFTFPFSVGSKSTSTRGLLPIMSNCDFIYNSSVLRLLKEGQFYDKAKIVSKRSDYIKSKIKKFSGVNVSGMVISIDSITLPPHITSSQKNLILPLYFNEEDLDKLIEQLKDLPCSL